jgi:hypothetical protein
MAAGTGGSQSPSHAIHRLIDREAGQERPRRFHAIAGGDTMIHGKRSTILVVLFFFAGALSARAGLIYQESTDGDLSYNGDPSGAAPPLLFTPGENRVSGTFGSVGPWSSSVTDFDSFRFVVPDHAKLVLVTARLTPSQRNTAPIAFGDFKLNPFDATPGTRIVAPGEQALFAASLPLGPGTHWFGHSAMGFSGAGVDLEIDYSLTFTVVGGAVAVPEAASLALAASALAGLAFCAVRPKRRIRARATRGEPAR